MFRTVNLPPHGRREGRICSVMVTIALTVMERYNTISYFRLPLYDITNKLPQRPFLFHQMFMVVSQFNKHFMLFIPFDFI